MEITFEKYREKDTELMREIWNDIVEDGVAFPGMECLDRQSFKEMLAEQTAVNCMRADGELAGFYILHPNNIGRCSHVSNASFALGKHARGKHIGRYLVQNCIAAAREAGFKGIQFNAVVVTNYPAIHIYQTEGFRTIGVIPGGFLLKNGVYSDMYIMYRDV